MKKRLAKAVLMSLAFNSLNICHANVIEIKESLDNEIVINGSLNNSIVDKSTSSDDDGISSDSGISKFDIENFSDEQITIDLSTRSDREYVYSFSSLKNNAKTRINGNISIFNDVSGGQYKSIENTGKGLSFTGKVQFVGEIYNSADGILEFTGGLEGLRFGDEQNINLLSYGNINNLGELTIKGGYLSLVAEAFQSTDNIGNIGNGTELIIHNEGTLLIESDNTSINDIKHISGTVNHSNNAKTTISLDNNDVFWGNIKGSNESFVLELGKGAYWDAIGQEDVVEGIVLNGGLIVIQALNNASIWESNDYANLKLKNFSTDGTGMIELKTDLANNIGDSVEFLGNTPAADLNIRIRNKNDNNGVDIKPEDNRRITIVKTPEGSDMLVKAEEVYFGNSTKVATPTIERASDDSINRYDFVGWTTRDAGNNLADEQDGQQIDHSILVEDVEPIFKRFNDLRTDPSEVGVWMRGETGETKIRNLSYDHNVMSGGYDWEHKNDNGILFTGVGFTYSTNECDDKAIGDTKGYGVNVYGSWLGKKNNDYVDLVVKYGKLDKSYAGYDENNIFVSGDYDKDLFTVSAKYGRRIFKDDWYYEPSVGLAWGKVGSANFTDNYNTPIHADASYSTIASLGMQVGKNIKGIEYYGKAEVMHDFDGKIHVSAPGRSVEDDMGGTWVKCAIGASRKIDENNSFYLEVERDFGNKVEKPYGFSLGYRFTW